MNIQWTTEQRPIASLKDWEDNPRKITEEQFNKLKDGIRARGFHDVIKIDEDGTILSGHQRKRALQELGMLIVWVMVPNRPLTHEERQAIAIESNLHRGFFDYDMLGNRFGQDMLTDLGMSFHTGGEPDAKKTVGVKRISFTIPEDQYHETMARITEAQNRLGCDTQTDLLLELLSGVEG